MAKQPRRPADSEPAEDTRPVAPDDLQLDANNPRLRHRVEQAEQDEILRILWREFSVDEIALSIAENGYFQYEPLFAAEEHGELVVVEGNRRLAAVKLLLHAGLRADVGATDLPRLRAARRRQLAELPVVVRDRDAIWQYIGFKHVNGPQAWQSYSKAQYIAWVHNELGVDLDKIAQHIGDRHLTVRRLYRGLMVLEQAEGNGVFNKEDRWKTHFSFSHLYTGLDYPGIQGLLKLPANAYRKNPVPKRQLRQLGELLAWLYGSRSRGVEPVVRTQNPDLKRLDDVLLSKDGTAALRTGMPLQVSLDISKGDERLLRETLVTAKQSLQDARGKVVTGYHGERDLLETATDIVDLAERIETDMREVSEEQTAKRRSSSRTASKAKRAASSRKR